MHQKLFSLFHLLWFSGPSISFSVYGGCSFLCKAGVQLGGLILKILFQIIFEEQTAIVAMRVFAQVSRLGRTFESHSCVGYL